MKGLPSLICLALLAVPGGALAQSPPSPASVGLTTDVPNLVQVLDSSRTWATMGTVDPVTHLFSPNMAPPMFTPPWTGGVASAFQKRGENVAYVTDFGASGSIQTTTGTLAAGSAALALAAAKDFANGQSVRVVGADAPFAGQAPSCTATTVGTGAGVTLNYYVAPLDSFFGYGPSVACPASNAPSTLNAQNYVSLAITPGAAAQFTGSLTGNQLNVTAVASGRLAPGQAIPFYAGARIIVQSSGTPGGTGTYLLNTETNFNALQAGTTLTATWLNQNLVICPGDTIQNGASNWPGATETVVTTPAGGSNCSSAVGAYTMNTSETVAAQTNMIMSAGPTHSLTAITGYAIYKQGGSFSSEAFFGLGDGDQPGYADVGQSSATTSGALPAYLPSTHPTAAKNDDCVRGVLGGGGTTALTLASSCPQAVTGATVFHSDTAAFNLCFQLEYCVIPTVATAYNVDGALAVVNANTFVNGQGRGSQIDWLGPQDLFVASGTVQGSGVSTYVNGTRLQQLYVLGKGSSSVGRGGDFAFMTQFGSVESVRFDNVFDGVHCFDCNINTFRDLELNNVTSQYVSCFHNYSDQNGGSGFDLQRGTCGVLGGSSYPITTQIPFWIDGAVAGGNIRHLTVASGNGEQLRISNDIAGYTNAGGGGPNGLGGPFGLKIIAPGIEFATKAGIHVAAGGEISIESVDSVNSGWKAFASCAASANLVIDPGVVNVSVTGSRFEAASGDGIFNNGTGTTISGGWVDNNSLTAAGGTSGNCPGIEWGPQAIGGTISGVKIGKTSGNTQSYPIQADLGATAFAFTGSSFIPGGSPAGHNHVNNLAGADGVSFCNGGSDIPDCVNANWLQPASPANNYLATALATTAAGTSPVAGSVYYMPIYVPRPMTFNGFEIKINTVGTTNVYAALYGSSGNQPGGAPLMTGSAVNTSIGALALAAAANYAVVSPGWYWIAIQSGDATVKYTSPSGGQSMTSFATTGVAGNIFTGVYGWSQAGTAGVWPSPPSGLSEINAATAAVVVGLKIASVP